MPAFDGMVDATLFRQVLGRYATGITLITAAQKDGDVLCGMVANSFTSVSLNPPLVSFCAGKGSTTWPLIKESGHFAVNILGDRHRDVCQAFVGKTADCSSLLADAPRGVSGSPLLPDALACIDCRIDVVHDAGDHELVIGAVLELAPREDCEPLLFYGGRFARCMSEPGG